MGPLWHKFVVFTTAAVVFVAHVACVCQHARAEVAAAVPAQPAPSHACCKHAAETEVPAADAESPAPDEPAGDHGRCRHCGTPLTPALNATNDGGAYAASGLHPFAVSARAPANALASARPWAEPGPAPSDPFACSAPTLLRLHCALNL